jgi:hypothetical protein
MHAVADFCRSCLPGRTSRLATTSVHVTVSIGLRLVGTSHKVRLRRKSFPAERTYFNDHPRLRTFKMDVVPTKPEPREVFLKAIRIIV